MTFKSLFRFTLATLVSVVILAEDPYAEGAWRSSLDSCWTETPECTRVMTVSHGGDWNAQYPYDSLPAFQNAFNNGADAVKVTKKSSHIT